MEPKSASRRRRTFLFLWMAAPLTLLTMMLGASLLILGEALARAHPALEWGLYSVAMAALGVAVVAPAARVLLAPALPRIGGDLKNADARVSRDLARHLLRRGSLSAEERAKLKVALELGRDVAAPLKQILSSRVARLDALVREHAALVFLSTAVSQNGRLDAVLVVTANFRMIRCMVDAVGVRPSILELLNVYAQVFWTALAASSIEDIELHEMFPALTASVVGAIPGFQLAAKSLLDGSANAFLTLRVGFIARNYLLNDRLETQRSAVRRSAGREAARALFPTLFDAAKKLPAGLSRVARFLFGGTPAEARMAVTS